MIVHVLNRAKESKVGEVIVATPDDKILQIVKENGGRAILTEENHHSGSDRVYEAYTKELKNNVDLIINLQGDMPNIQPDSISKLASLMQNNDCDIGTLASSIKNKSDISNPNVVKVHTAQTLKDDNFLEAKIFSLELAYTNSINKGPYLLQTINKNLTLQ